jgi:capsular polysaccharide biosynthesis protein
MELNEVIGRIFGRHRTLIVVFLLLGALAGLGLNWRDQPLYASSARVTIGDADPTTPAQSTAVADTVRAIATGPQLVRAALATIPVDRDPNLIALNNISVESLGSSGVVQITVSDPDPQVAVALTNAIANGVVADRQNAATVQQQAALASIASRTTDLTARINAIDNQMSALIAAQASPVAATALRANAQADLLTTQRSLLTASLAVLQNEQANIESNAAGHPAADVTDPATTPALPVPTRRLADLVLGALLGLLLGIALAAGVESLRPTVVGRGAIARAVGAPVLAELTGRVEDWDVPDVAEAAMHVELAAAGANVRRLELMATERKVDLTTFAEVLGSAAPYISINALEAETKRALSSEGSTSTRHHVGARENTFRRGLILVVPGSVKLADLDEVKNFQSISGWPLVGVIVTHRTARRGRAEVPSSPPAPESEVLA